MSTEHVLATQQMRLAIERLRAATENHDLPAQYNALTDCQTAFDALWALNARYHLRVAS